MKSIQTRSDELTELCRLGMLAAQTTNELRLLHWDNCKVDFELGRAYRYVLEFLRKGRDATEIVKAYDRALHECHAYATDRTASRGQVCRFSLSSTVFRARRRLASKVVEKPASARV